MPESAPEPELNMYDAAIAIGAVVVCYLAEKAHALEYLPAFAIGSAALYHEYRRFRVMVATWSIETDTDQE